MLSRETGVKLGIELNVVFLPLKDILPFIDSDPVALTRYKGDLSLADRKGRSVETALESITDAVYIVWSIGGANIASLLLLDIARAFDNILYERLLYNLKVKGILIRIV